MTATVAAPPLLFGEANWEATGALRWLSPALIGLSGPIVFGLLLFPNTMDHARTTLTTLLFALLLVCIAAYIMSVVTPRNVVSLLVDRRARAIELVSSGLFASQSRTMAFEDIADLCISKSYDDDGYALDRAELRLVDGEIIGLPADMTSADVNVARRALGFGQDTPRRR